MIMYRCKMIPSRARLEIFLNIFGQNMLIENLNSMLSKARHIFFEKFLCYLSVKRCNLGLRM